MKRLTPGQIALLATMTLVFGVFWASVRAYMSKSGAEATVGAFIFDGAIGALLYLMIVFIGLKYGLPKS